MNVTKRTERKNCLGINKKNITRGSKLNSFIIKKESGGESKRERRERGRVKASDASQGGKKKKESVQEI